MIATILKINIKTMNKFTYIILIATFLCSCGVRGDLYLPGEKPSAHNKVKTDSNDGAQNIENKDK